MTFDNLENSKVWLKSDCIIMNKLSKAISSNSNVVASRVKEPSGCIRIAPQKVVKKSVGLVMAVKML